MKQITHKIAILFLLLFALALAGESYASDRYDEMRAEYENKSAVSGYSANIKIIKPVDAEPQKRTTDASLDVFKRLVERWNINLQSTDTTTFYPLDKRTKEIAKGISDDEEKIRILLQDKVSLDPLIALALMRNPMIKAAQKRVHAAYERFSQVNNLDLIMRDYLAFTNTLSTRLTDKRGKKMVAMEFPFPGMTSLKGKIIDKDITIEKLELEKVRIQMITKLKKLYYEQLYLMREKRITNKTLALLKELEQVANVKYETGRTSFNDVIKVQIKLEKLKDTLKTIDEKQSNVKVKIAKMLSLPANIEFGKFLDVRVTIDKSLDELYKISAENNIEVLIVSEKVKRMALMIDMARKKFYPDFTMGYSYFNGAGFMTKPMTDHTKNSDYARNDAYIREAQEKLGALSQIYTAKQDATATKIKDASYHIDKATREVALYRNNLIVKSKEAMEVAKVGYETGRVSFLDALDADMMWLNFNVEHFKSVRHILVSIAELESAAGVSLSQALPEK